jgi:hypothetical protein
MTMTIVNVNKMLKTRKVKTTMLVEVSESHKAKNNNNNNNYNNKGHNNKGGRNSK